MPKILEISAISILDSRGTPTLKVFVSTESGARGCACVPSGASTGIYEAHELRDGTPEFLGKGVSRACENVNTTIANALVGKYCCTEQREIDNALINLDGTTNKQNLGANAILGVSLAVAHAAADYYGLSLYEYIGGVSSHLLPTPMMNVINGGAHVSEGLDFQEFMIMPVGAKSFNHAVQMGSEIFHHLKKILIGAGLSSAVGDEGGFAPKIKSAHDALSLLCDAVRQAGYDVGKDVCFALDAAASELYNSEDGLYHLDSLGKTFTPEQLADYYVELCERFPIISIEDPFEQNDFESFASLCKALSHKVQIVGDDLFVTNTERLCKGVSLGAANSILIKPNQIGTLSQTIDAIVLAKRSDYSAVMSHRSGETEDTTIADLCVALNTGQIKCGSLSRSERTAKYNRLIEIELLLGENARYAGRSAFNNLK